MHRHILLLVILLFTCGTEAIEKTKEIRPHNIITVFEEFGFQENGTLKISSQISPTPLPTQTDSHIFKFYLCSLDQWKEFLLLVQNRASMICHPHFYTDCEMDGVDPLSKSLEHYSVAQTDLYHLILVTCYQPSTQPTFPQITITYSLINPHNQQLSSENIPLPKIYTILCITWIVLIFVWLILWLHNRARSDMQLHGLVALLLLQKLASCLASWHYWQTCESKGVCPPLLLPAHTFLFSTSESLLLILLLLISRGWKLAKPALSPRMFRSSVVTFFLLSLAFLFIAIYNEEVLFLCLIMIFLYLLPRILANVAENVSALEMQETWLNALRASLSGEEIATVQAKLLIFRRLRRACFVYLPCVYCTGLTLHLMISSYWNLTWFRILDDEIVLFLNTVVICWTLRPMGGANPYWFFPNLSLDLSKVEEALFHSPGDEQELETLQNVTVIEYPLPNLSDRGTPQTSGKGLLSSVFWKDDSSSSTALERDVGSMALTLAIPLRYSSHHIGNVENSSDEVD